MPSAAILTNEYMPQVLNNPSIEFNEITIKGGNLIFFILKCTWEQSSTRLREIVFQLTKPRNATINN